ncbi:hypothetical protein ACFL23_03945, partial [Patescibacteria group bacterium]
KKIFFAVEEKGAILKKEYKIINRQAEKMIKKLHSFLEKQNINIKSIKGIIAVNGPGTFTSIRAGVSIANGLSYSLNIPVVGIKLNEVGDNLVNTFKIGLGKLKFAGEKSQFIQPFYDKEPNITQAKKQ